MAYDARVYRILIASPSDVEDEREMAARVIQDWNDLNSYNRNITLLPLRWETHAAPEYPTRPQEVINRAIVDECDLLVGIFWTRIGSPTGVADSGTIEEIQRVGRAGKPIMLYFSRVEIDPENIDTEQFEKLKAFKKTTFPQGLVEGYKKLMEFRDKFSRQLEIKVRDLHRNDSEGKDSLFMKFVSTENGELIASPLTHRYESIHISNFPEIPKASLDKIKLIVDQANRNEISFPIAMAIENCSSSGIRHLYIELELSASSENVEITTPNTLVALSEIAPIYRSFLPAVLLPSKFERDIEAKFDLNRVQKTSKGWRMSCEWDAIQPQRVRLIKPVVYVYSPQSSQIIINAKIFADTFADPLVLTAELKMEAIKTDKSLGEFLPNWEKLLKEKENEGEWVRF
jgi:hypothetical protein